MKKILVRGLLLIAEVSLCLLADHIRQRRATDRQSDRPLRVIPNRHSHEKRGRTLPAVHTIRDRRRAI